MSNEERMIQALVESVFNEDDGRLQVKVEELGRDPQEEASLLQGMLSRTVDSFRKFFFLQQERADMSPKDVAERYGHNEDWVYKNRELREICVRVGNCLRWRESDLQQLERKQGSKRRGFVMRQIPQNQTEPGNAAKVRFV